MNAMNKQLCAVIAALGIVTAPAVFAAPRDYHFELAGPPTTANGKSIVLLHLVHVLRLCGVDACEPREDGRDEDQGKYESIHAASSRKSQA